MEGFDQGGDGSINMGAIIGALIGFLIGGSIGG